MKYLHLPVLQSLSSALSDNPSAESRVHVRFEAYSVKPIGKERKMFKEMEEAYLSGQEEMEEMGFSPDMKEAGLSSVLGRLDEKESRKMHFILVSTLNSAFPDHDFSSLRPDHFIREINADQVLKQLGGSLLGPSGVPLTVGGLPAHLGVSPSGSNSSPNTSLGSGSSPDLKRALSDVMDLHDAEVFSWFPSPEYDPHVEAEDGELSDEELFEDEDDLELDEELLEDADGKDQGMDIEMDEPAWGQAGMELDDENDNIPKSSAMAKSKSGSGSGKKEENISPKVKPKAKQREDDGTKRRIGGLLWSANYFFYSRRQKRVLFITAWCRKRVNQPSSPDEPSTMLSAFPAPISASFTPPTAHIGHMGLVPLSLGKYRPRTHNAAVARRKPKPQIKGISGGVTGTIPIRSSMDPHPKTPSRLATSAPSTFSPLMTTTTTPNSASAIARMTAGGFKPRQTPAKALINAAREATPTRNAPRASGLSLASGSTGGTAGPSNSTAVDLSGEQNDDSRVRKDRSESTTPGPTRSVPGLLKDMVGQNVGDIKGKRPKVV